MKRLLLQLKWVGLLLPFVLLQACPGTRTGNPSSSEFIVTASGQVSTVAWNENYSHPSLFKKIKEWFIPTALSLPPPTILADYSGNYLVTLSASWVSLKEVEFKSSESGEEESEISFQGPYFVNLLLDPPASLGDLSAVGPGPFRRVKFKLEKEGSPPSDAPAGLVGRSLYISGTLSGGGLSNQSFSYAAADGSEFEVGGPNSVSIEAGKNLVLSLRLAQLFSKIDLTALDGAGDRNIRDENRINDASSPCPLIDGSAADLFTCFRKGLEQSANFGKDDDGDFELEDGEDSVDD